MVHLHLHLHLDLILHLNLNPQVAHIESRLPRDRDILVHCKTGNALTLPRYRTHTCVDSLPFSIY